MHSYLHYDHFDLVSPDGFIEKITFLNPSSALVEVCIKNISPAFVGYQIQPQHVDFNFKSILAQIGLNAHKKELVLDPKAAMAHVKVELSAIGDLARKMLSLLSTGTYIGKLFAADERRLVKNPDYLTRMFGRNDREGSPLLSLGKKEGKELFLLERVEGHTVAFLSLLKGKIEYASPIEGLLPSLQLALQAQMSLRTLLRLHQKLNPFLPRTMFSDEILLVASPPLHIRTAFARVVEHLLPTGFHHTSANTLQPNTEASGDIYELFGCSDKEIDHIPLEFFTLEPHREHVFFSDRDQLQNLLDNPENIFKTFQLAPKPDEFRTAVFIVKGSQMLRLKQKDWISTNPQLPLPLDTSQKIQQSQVLQHYIEKQPCYPFLRAIEKGLITSQGVLFTRYFPSPLIKRMLLSYYVQKLLKGIYFEIPSKSNGYYFSQEDRSMLVDLFTFGIPVYWANRKNHHILQYIQRPYKSSGMFVPLHKVKTFLKATFFGIYGSNLIAGNFENDLKKIFQSILQLQEKASLPLLNPSTPLALVTGGGPGVMEIGNRIAKELNILSCANIVDFSSPQISSFIQEQKQNPYVEAKMTYRLDHLIERQAEFYLDFPIFLQGGIGTDFEYSLEELRHKVGSAPFVPVILFGPPDYWRQKITSRFQCNLSSGTIKGSEWVSNSFFCIQTAEQGIRVYQDFFEGKLKIGTNGPVFKDGFVIVE